MPERDTAIPAPDQSPEPKPGIEQKSGLGLSAVQVVGGALAAMTAAGLGSRFSVEGTLVGAALASVIAAVAGALYTASLRRTSAAVRGAVSARRTRLPRSEGSGASTPVPHGSTAAAPQSPAEADGPARTSRRWTLVLSSVVGAVAIFALAAGALTLYEAIAGEALSGGSGTTFSQVQQGGSDDRPTDESSPTPTESTEPSESADPTPTAESSGTPEANPAPPTEPSPEPSVEPSTQPSTTSEPEPSATEELPSAAPSQPDQTPR